MTVIPTIALLALALPGPPDAPLELVRAALPIVLDGRLDDEAWRAVPPLPLTMYSPVYRGTPAQRTEIRVTYDDEAMYAAGWFYDDDPSGIRVNSLYRDRWNGDDAFAIYVDAFNDDLTAKWFGVTPAGMRFDQLVSGDGASLNASWDGFWDVRTTVTPEGWFAEVRIPFSTLGFQVDADGIAIMGLTVTRLVSRTGERVTFPDIDPRFEFRQPSRAGDIILRNVTSDRPVYVTPYALAGFDRRSEIDAVAGSVIDARNRPREVGLDMRYGPTPGLTLDLTVNTDFAQVEADDQQINLDRFSLFYPEKRRFFQEGSGTFDFPTGAGGQLFHSRRIGLVDNQPVPVQGGARLVGRAGVWDVGMIGMRTAPLHGNPAELFGVARVRRSILDPLTNVGAMATLRTRDGRSSSAFGVDGRFHLFAEDYLSATLSGSHDTEATPFDLRDNSQVLLHWFRQSSRGMRYSLSYARAGEAWLPAVGFAARPDFTAANANFNYFVYTDDHPILRRFHPGGVVEGTWRNGDGVLESGRIAAWMQVQTKAGADGWIEPQLFVEDVLVGFPIGNVDVPAGRYTFANVWLYWGMPTGRTLRTGADLQVGSFFDGTRAQLTLSPTWNVSRHLELGVQYVGNRIDFSDRDQRTTLHLGRLRVRTALDTRASGAAFIQYNSTTRRVEANIRLRYNFAEGTDLWIVYNEGLATEREPFDTGPRLPLSVARGLTIKYSRTFVW